MSDSSSAGSHAAHGRPRYRGLTWDHPRGRNALEAAAVLAASEGGVLIDWDSHPLEGFESAPIAELAERYDLIVLDHPHLGEALASGSFVPLSEIFDAALLDRIAADAIGPSFTSYSLDGAQWALPLDAATQVAAARVDLIADAVRAAAAQAVDAHSAWGSPADGLQGVGGPQSAGGPQGADGLQSADAVSTGVADSVPSSWSDVVALSQHAPVALSLAGPHAFLTFASVLAGAGAPVADGHVSGSLFSSRQVAREVFELLATIARSSPAATHGENPIALLERMASTDSLAYVPLVYGYVNYSSPALQFRDAPRWAASARLGSTIGGTGIAISKRCQVTPELVAHLSWLLEPETQRDFIPNHDGQPGLRSAWHDAAVNEAAHNFYANTAATIEASWVRPRYDGYIAFQAKASEILREALLGAAGGSTGEAAGARLGNEADACLDALEAAFAASAPAAAAATESVAGTATVSTNSVAGTATASTNSAAGATAASSVAGASTHIDAATPRIHSAQQSTSGASS